VNHAQDARATFKPAPVPKSKDPLTAPGGSDIVRDHSCGRIKSRVPFSLPEISPGASVLK